MDAGLAKIMNSSVGTSAVKALDAILKTDNTAIANSAADRLYSLLKSELRLVGSDEVLHHYDGAWTQNRGNATTSKYLSFNTSGTVVLKTIQTNSDSEHSRSIRVYEGSTTNPTVTIDSVYVNMPQNSMAEISVAINVKPNTKYYVSVFCTNANYYPQTNLDVCGKLVPFTGTVVTEV